MTLEEINSERKSLNEQLKSLKTQRDAKNLALQQRNEMFNSDKFLASLYKVDPTAASFFADKQVKQRQLDINANKLYSETYTPEQKSIVDAKQQNRIRMGDILSTINTLKAKGATETEIKQWQSQYDSLVANDKRLNSLLANLQTPGYTSTEVVQTPNKSTEKGSDKIIISPTENNDKYLEFLKTFDLKNYKNASDFPTSEVIQATASNQGYSISSEDSKKFADSMVAKLKTKSDENYRASDEERKARVARLTEEEKAADFALIVKGIEELKKNPNDPTVLNSVLTSLLRLESGAAIGADEYINRAKDYMSIGDYESFVDEISNPVLNIKEKVLSGSAKTDVQTIQAKYIARMNANKIIESSTLIVPASYYKINKARLDKSKTPADAGNNNAAGYTTPPPTGRAATNADFD